MARQSILTKELSRGARGLVGLSQRGLATAAHVSESTVRDFEKGRRVPSHNNLLALQMALEDAGVDFLLPEQQGPEQKGGAVGLRLRPVRDVLDAAAADQETVVVDALDNTQDVARHLGENTFSDHARVDQSAATADGGAEKSGPAQSSQEETSKADAAEKESNPFSRMHDLLAGLQKSREDLRR